jgi:hypothetical protein
MTAFVQPRHIKLGLAGKAAYKLDQLRETFADVAEILPKYRNLSVPNLITSTVKSRWWHSTGQFGLRTAQFAAAYEQLTALCNACHQRYDRTLIVIQPPTAAATFPDQDFRSPTK